MTEAHGQTPTIRVAVVDDQALVRGGLSMLIASQPDMTVAVEASDGQEALDILTRTPVDVVLMDVRMPRVDGLEATRRLLDGRADGPKVVMLTTFDLDEYVLAAIRVGASGFLLKDARPEQLLEAVRTVARGDAVIAPSMTRRLLDHVAPLIAAEPAAVSDAARLVATLTERERDVFLLIAAARSNAEIAADLFLSEATVKTHVAHILTKLGARDRVQAVVVAYEAGVVGPNSPHPKG
jgi:DNA-binding NarL/FixJ family response regulator